MNTLLRTKVIEELLPGIGKDKWLTFQALVNVGDLLLSYSAYLCKRLNVY